MVKIRSILHPTDFSDSSKAAFTFACALARDYGARLTVVHVKPPPINPSGVMAAPPIDPDIDPAEVRRQLDEIQAPDSKISLDRVMLVGDEAGEIVHLAAENGYDLIIMGTHGRSGLARMLMGSVAEKVLRKAHCPVVTVKQPFKGAE